MSDPNIIVVFGDQQRYNTMGCTGNRSSTDPVHKGLTAAREFIYGHIVPVSIDDASGAAVRAARPAQPTRLVNPLWIGSSADKLSLLQCTFFLAATSDTCAVDNDLVLE